MATLYLLRHGESLYNAENRFTGWTDVPLTPLGEEKAEEAGSLAKTKKIHLDAIYCSLQSRTLVSAERFLETFGEEVPVIQDWRLNERHYGALQGMKRSDAAALYGKEQVERWRRSAEERPPLVGYDDPRYPANDPYYQAFIAKGMLRKEDCPRGESLLDTQARVLPFVENVVMPRLEKNENVLLLAHGNSLRAIRKAIEGISDADIKGLEIAFAGLYAYTFDSSLCLVEGGYLR